MTKISCFYVLFFLLSLPCDSKQDDGFFYTDASRYKQMERAANILPIGFDVKLYRHFHISSKKEDKYRMRVNLQDIFGNSDLEVISIGCSDRKQCIETVETVLDVFIEERYSFEKLTVLVPGFIGVKLEEKFNLVGTERLQIY